MESIGEKLRGAREEKGYSVDQVARDTNIARRFIEALEREDFSEFPGDTYVLGFLRNYADYLGLDQGKIVTLYKNLKIQEQPVPVEELIHRKRNIPVGAIAIGLAVILVLGGGGYGVYHFFLQGGNTSEKPVQEEADRSAEKEPSYVMEEEIIEQRFDENDMIRVRLDSGSVDVKITDIGEKVGIDYGRSSLTLALGKEEELDLNDDGREDIKLSVHDIQSADKTVVLRLDRNLFDAGVSTAQRQEVENEESSELAVGNTNAESREEEVKTIVTTDREEPFRLSVVFRGYCLLRYVKDTSIREERYFHKGETFRLDVTEEVKLWISNAGSFKARVAGEEVSFGGPGEVSVKILRWEENEETGRSALKLIPVY